MRSWLHGSIGLLAAAAVAACGGDVQGTTAAGSGGAGGEGSGASTASSTGTGAGGAAWAAYCDARASLCGGTGDKCKTQEACAGALLRDDIEDALFDCLATNCDEDDCLGQVVAQFPPSAAGQQYAATCQAYLAQCPDGLDDLCGAAGYLADDMLDDMGACMEAATCAEIEACLDQLIGGTFDACEDWL
jgi:hypothetical protein